METSKVKKLLKLKFLLLVFINYLQLSSSVETDPNRHIKVLDPERRYRVEWQLDFERERVLFNVTVQTVGFIGLGLARGTQIDWVIGGVDSNGRSYFSDRNAIGNLYQFPILDVRQDWTLHQSSENGSHTSLLFSRNFDTCDREDVVINDDSLDVIWLYGETDNILEYFNARRGSTPAYLLASDLTPASLSDDATVKSHPSQVFGRNASVWNINRSITIPNKRTTYWCKMHKFNVPTKHHIIGWNVSINADSRDNVHHLILWRCVLPQNMNATEVYEPWVDHPGDECFIQGDPFSQLPSHYCTELKMGSALGGDGPFFLPDNVGYPIGDISQTEYYFSAVHYDNTEGRPIESSIDISIYHTPDLREHDGGIIAIGSQYPGSPAILLPPGSSDHYIFGHCSSNCTSRMFPPEGINAFAGLLHSHDGRKMRLHHFRGNMELAPIANDDNYNARFQPFRLMRNVVNILPGDQLSARCLYGTTSRSQTTVGGFGTDQEMCIVFLSYFNFIRHHPTCLSDLISPAYTAKYLGGAMNLTWNQNRIEFMATAPKHLAGMTVSEISDSQYVNWNGGQRAELQLDHIVHPQVAHCLTIDEIAAAQRAVASGQPLPPPQDFASFPVEIPQYVPPRTCSALPPFLQVI